MEKKKTSKEMIDELQQMVQDLSRMNRNLKQANLKLKGDIKSLKESCKLKVQGLKSQIKRHLHDAVHYTADTEINERKIIRLKVLLDFANRTYQKTWSVRLKKLLGIPVRQYVDDTDLLFRNADKKCSECEKDGEGCVKIDTGDGCVCADA